jgi:hypothetical protein
MRHLAVRTRPVREHLGSGSDSGFARVASARRQPRLRHVADWRMECGLPRNRSIRAIR